MPKSKKMTRSNWAIRPLSIAQCQYAALDTVHLITLYGTLREALTANGQFLRVLEDSQEMMRRAKSFKRVEKKKSNSGAHYRVATLTQPSIQKKKKNKKKKKKKGGNVV